MKKLSTTIWSSVISTIQTEIENVERLRKKPDWQNDKFLEQRLSNLEIALKEFETQQLEDLLS